MLIFQAGSTPSFTGYPFTTWSHIREFFDGTVTARGQDHALPNESTNMQLTPGWP